MPHPDTTPIHVLWDESHLWGLMLWHAADHLDWPARAVTCAQVARGILERNAPRLLIVPGGWAGRKAANLGPTGRQAVREYVASGGRYLGFCGGAGLGLASSGRAPALDICPWSRRPVDQRLPNFSGHVRCLIHGNHDLGSNEEKHCSLPVWWPSQFSGPRGDDIEILASYHMPDRDFMVSDLWTRHIPDNDFPSWEKVYGINLDPRRLRGEPCIIRGRLGRGSYVLSYPHLETPDAPEANLLLHDLLKHWADIPGGKKIAVPEWTPSKNDPLWDDPALGSARDALEALILQGREHFLLTWRRAWLLNWRRGVPGSALTALWAMVCTAASQEPENKTRTWWQKNSDEFQRLMQIFHRQCAKYLMRERLSLASGPSSPEKSGHQEVQELRETLFGKFPGYGGLYGKIIHLLDRLLYKMRCRPDPS